MSSPWWNPEPSTEAGEVDEVVAACEPAYRELMKTLNACSRADPALPSLAAIIALVDLAGDMVVNTGLLWQTPDLVVALRDLADTLERRRDTEVPKPVFARLRQLFAAARPAAAN